MRELVVCAQSGKHEAAARALAARLGLRFTAECFDVLQEDTLVLSVNDDGLTLARGQLSLRADFAHLLPRVKPGVVQRELLVKAAKVRSERVQPLVVDATAGLGEDALLLAAAGFQVRLFEHNPVIAALLDDAMRRAACNPALAPIVACMSLVETDSTVALQQLPEQPDVVLLDPMFPARTKSAAVKKKFQLLHELEDPTTEADARALLLAAIAAHPRKVVVKRPPKGPYLGGIKPNYSLSGKAVRYDCIVVP